MSRTELERELSRLLADAHEGKRLNSPNDVVVASDGSVWFTDPVFGIAGDYEGDRAEPELPQNVYRLDPGSGRLDVVAEGMLGPNGLCFSPDETILYLVESRAVPTRRILAFDVDGGRLKNQRLFIDAGPGGTPDGIRCDVDGNLWCGWGMGAMRWTACWCSVLMARPSATSGCPSAAPICASEAPSSTGSSWRQASPSTHFM